MSVITSKTVGDIGEATAIAEFTKRDIPVLLPFGDNNSFDLVIVVNNEFKKVQVKTTLNTHDGFMRFNTTKSHGRSSYRPYTLDEVDYFYFYCVATDISCLYPAQNGIPKNNIIIRTHAPKNNQKLGINMYHDYDIDNILENKLVQ